MNIINPPMARIALSYHAFESPEEGLSPLQIIHIMVAKIPTPLKYQSSRATVI